MINERTAALKDVGFPEFIPFYVALISTVHFYRPFFIVSNSFYRPFFIVSNSFYRPFSLFQIHFTARFSLFQILESKS
jgi:hypothetical protein